LASVDVTKLKTTEAYPSSDLTNIKYNMYIDSGMRSEGYAANYNQQINTIRKYILDIFMELKIIIKKYCLVFNRVDTDCRGLTKLILADQLVSFSFYHSVQNLLSSHLISKNIKIRIYKNLILPVVLYGCETWSLTLREENRLRRIFGPKREEVTGGWRKLYNEELHNLYSSPSIIIVIMSRRMRWAGHAARMGERRNAYRILVGNPDGKRPLGRPRQYYNGS
jgi:hypothetical protein